MDVNTTAKHVTSSIDYQVDFAKSGWLDGFYERRCGFSERAPFFFLDRGDSLFDSTYEIWESVVARLSKKKKGKGI